MFDKVTISMSKFDEKLSTSCSIML